MPYTLLNHTGQVALDGVSYFGVGAAPPLCGLQLDFYSSPCSQTTFLVGRCGGVPSPSRYDLVLGLEWMNDKSGGGFCRATLVHGGLPGSDGADDWIFGVFGGHPLNSFFSLSGAPVPKFNFNADVVVIDDLYDSVQSVPLKYTGPWNVVSGNINDTARCSYSPSLIASLPLDLPHTGGYLKYSATFHADGGDDIDGIAICVSWQRPSGLMNKCDVLQKGMVLNGSRVLSGTNSVGVWYATAYALKMPSVGAYNFPYHPVNQKWLYLEDAEGKRSQLFNCSEIDTTISDEAVAIDIWVENLTVCPEGFRTDPLNGFEDQNCSLEVSPMSITRDRYSISATGSPVSVENFVAAEDEQDTSDSHDRSHDCGGGSGVTICKIKSTSASWAVPIIQEVLGSSGKIELSLEPVSYTPASKIGDCMVLSADSLSISATLSIQSGGIGGDEDAIALFHSDDADSKLHTENGRVTYTWQSNSFPRPFGENELMSLTINIAVNYGNLPDDINGSLLLSLVATPHLEFEWCSDEVCPIERGQCARETWPVLGWSQSYTTVSNCKCFLGFGGEACSDRVVSEFVLFVWLVLLCGSMAAGLPSVRLAIRLEPITRIVGVMLIGSMITTALGVGDYWIVGLTICICAVLMLGSWCVEIYYLSTITENLGCRGAVSKFFLSGNYLNTTKLSIGLLALFCGAISFSLSGKLNYAITHSIWHICVMGSSYSFLQSRCWKCPGQPNPSQSDDHERLIGHKEIYHDTEEDGIDFVSVADSTDL
eukprot:226830_1